MPKNTLIPPIAVKIMKYSVSPKKPSPKVDTIEPKSILLKINMFYSPKYFPWWSAGIRYFSNKAIINPPWLTQTIAAPKPPSMEPNISKKIPKGPKMTGT